MRYSCEESEFDRAIGLLDATVAAVDTAVIIANLFLIAAIVVLPFSTEAVGDPSTEGLALPTATMAINVAVASGLSTLVYWLAWRRDLLDPRPAPVSSATRCWRAWCRPRSS